MDDKKMVRKDFITSIILITFSVSVIVMSYEMPRLERRGIDPFSAPGVVPGMIGIILLSLALILFVRSIRHGGYRFFQKETGLSGENRHQGAGFRVLLTLVISLIYAIGFLGRFDYSLCTALYIFTFICLFEFKPGIALLSQKRMFVFAIIQAVAASLLISIILQKLFLVDLP